MKNGASAGLLGKALLASGLAAGLACAWQLQERIDIQKAGAETESDQLELRSGKIVKALSLEYAPLAGAMYWTGAVQYYGNKRRQHDKGLELLWPMLDITTTLDPNLIVAYRFGSTFLSDVPPRGAGHPELAVKLLERGIAANPEYWRFYQDLGNVYYFDMKDYAKASKAFETGSRYPNTPVWMKVMAARIAAEGESLETSYFLWQDLYRTTTDEQIKKNAETHLKLVRAQMDIRKLNELVEEYQKQTKARPEQLMDLVQAGLLRGIPRDPEGYPYVIGANGKAELNAKSPQRDVKMP